MTGAEISGAAFAAAAARAGLAWLFTYFLHGAIAAAGAAVFVRVARPAPAAEHRLWKMGLLLPFVSASIAELVARHALVTAAVPHAPVVFSIPMVVTAGTASTPSPADLIASGFALVLAVGIAAGAARFALGLARLRCKVGDRRAPVSARLASSLARMGARFDLGSIELTESDRLTGPMAIGARAICFPAGDHASLTDAEIDAALAHELAHLERRDPFWFFLAGLVQGALWMQPLNRRLVARLRRSAELACDDRAVAVTGDARDLARALSWFAHAAYDSAHASLAGEARAPSALVERVRRLASAATGQAALSSRALVLRSEATAALLASVCIGSTGMTVAFARSAAAPAPPATTASAESTPSPVDLAAMSRRVADLGNAEIRIEAQLATARALAGSEPEADTTSPRILELERDLRHAHEERVWLEQSVYGRSAQ